MLLSEKQRSFIAHSDAFLNIADGAVRSGKTHAALIRFAEMCAKGPAGDFAIFGKTERTVKRNVVYPLMEGLPRGSVRYVQGAGELYVWGRRCWIVGANDARAEEKVRGMTLAGAYANEVTLYPEEVFQQLIDRCSVADAQILADCNPDSPYHWLAEKFLDADLPKSDLKRWRFRIHDNPALSEEYVQRLSRMHTGLWYRRMVEGEWCVAEGAVYDMFDESIHVVDELPASFERTIVGVDYGTSNPTVFIALGKSGEAWYAFAEMRHEGQAAGRARTDAEHSAALSRFLFERKIAPSSIEVDPAAASFVEQLRRDGVRKVRPAQNAVLDGIRTVSRALTTGELYIHSSCEQLIREMTTYSWDPRAQKRGEDKPIKQNDHSVDALRYAVMRALGRSALSVVRRPQGL